MNILFDIGGTKTRIALSDGIDIVGDALIFETPKDYGSGFDLLVNKARLLTSEKITSVAGGIAGIIDITKSNLLNLPNLPDWNQKNLKLDLESAFGCPARIENDAALAALGEAVFGSGKDANTVSFLTFGTGVGGARIIDKKIDNSLYGFEPGHHIVDVNLLLSGKDSDLEYFTSGSGIQKRLSQKPNEIKDQNIWQEIMTYMSIGIVNALYFWPCDKFVIGGGLTRHPLTNFEYIQSKVKSFSKVHKNIPSIVKSELGELSCLYGALAYLNTQ